MLRQAVVDPKGKYIPKGLFAAEDCGIAAALDELHEGAVCDHDAFIMVALMY